MGRVVRIYIASDKGQPMQEVWSVRAIPVRGLEGDRYMLGRGMYSDSKRPTVRDVSLIAFEAIVAANAGLPQPFLPSETRRNIVTEGIDLNLLVEKRFVVGEVQMRGVELCSPCKHPERLVGKEGFEKAFEGRGGLRAAILSNGTITVGDSVDVA